MVELPVLDHDSIRLDMFKAPSWLMVGTGVGAFDQTTLARLAGNFAYGKHLREAHQSLLQKQAHYVSACTLHTELLTLLRSSSPSNF